MNRRSLLREAASAVRGRRSTAPAAPAAAQADLAHVVALSTGMQPLLACLAQVAIELLALQAGAAPDRGGQPEKADRGGQPEKAADAVTEAA